MRSDELYFKSGLNTPLLSLEREKELIQRKEEYTLRYAQPLYRMKPTRRIIRTTERAIEQNQLSATEVFSSTKIENYAELFRSLYTLDHGFGLALRCLDYDWRANLEKRVLSAAVEYGLTVKQWEQGKREHLVTESSTGGEEPNPELASIEDKISNYIQMIRVPPEEINEMVRTIRTNMGLRDRTIEQLVLANQRLVVSIGKRHLKTGLDLMELVQYGNMGLLRAACLCDPDYQNKFATYAVWWIRQAITRGIIDDSRTIRIPAYAVEKLNKIYRTAAGLYPDLGREPTAKEIGDILGLPAKEVAHLLKSNQEPISLQTPVGEERDTELMEFVQDKTIAQPEEEEVSGKQLKEKVRKVFQTLTPREEKVLRMRFGIGEDGDFLLEEIGAGFPVARERIRQMEAKALRKRNPPQRRKLSLFDNKGDR